MITVSDEQLERIARDAGMRVGYMSEKGMEPQLVVESARFPGSTIEDFRNLVRVAYEAGIEDDRAKREGFMRSNLSAAWRDAIAERHRQIQVEGFTSERDDVNYRHHEVPNGLARAAACYALSTIELVWSRGLKNVWTWLAGHVVEAEKPALRSHTRDCATHSRSRAHGPCNRKGREVRLLRHVLTGAVLGFGTVGSIFVLAEHGALERTSARHADNVDYWRERCNSVKGALTDACVNMHALTLALDAALSDAAKYENTRTHYALCKLHRLVRERVADLRDLRERLIKAGSLTSF